MPFRYYSPGATIFALVVAGLLSFFSSKSKRTAVRETPEEAGVHEEDANVAAMKKVVEEHDGWTAEVFNISVFGRRRVRNFRILSPGRKVELRMIKGEIKVFSYGDYISDLFTTSDSNLPRLFKEQVSFDAYLGGRNRLFLEDDDYDSCSIIVFYKLDGVPPTKVNLM